jgi:hypothetical protein
MNGFYSMKKSVKMLFKTTIVLTMFLFVCVHVHVCFQSKRLPRHAPDTRSKHAQNEKAVSRSNEQLTSEKTTEPKVNKAG